MTAALQLQRAKSPMKKFTILILSEFEDLILDGIGRIGITQIKKVTGREYERLPRVEEVVKADYEELWKRFHSLYEPILASAKNVVGPVKSKVMSLSLMSELSESPEEKVDELIVEMEAIKYRIGRLRLINLINSEKTARNELEKSIAVGVVSRELLPRVVGHFRSIKGIAYRVISTAPAESTIIVSPAEKVGLWVREWVRSIFATQGAEYLTYSDEGSEMSAEELAKEAEEIKAALVKFECVDRILKTKVRLSQSAKGKILRTKMMSVIQGWVPTPKLPILEKRLNDLKEEVEGCIFVKYEEPDPGEEPPRIIGTPKFFKPIEPLVKLRGFPSSREINPVIVLYIVYAVMFGMMFGDVGQGLAFLGVGLFITFRLKIKGGMFGILGSMFIPMGISSVIFGFLYGEFFLMEGIVPALGFHPMHEVTLLMKLALLLALVEISFGIGIGIVNSYRRGDILSAIMGEQGVAALMVLLGGAYLGHIFLTSGMSLMAAFSDLSIAVPVVGVVMVFLKPLVEHQLTMETLGEGIAAALMSVIELLASVFSFIRVAAFTLAHAALAIAASALIGVMGLAGPLIANGIAMSFELISCSVQSLRLLYYEFMSRFYKGTGKPFKPFVIR